MPSNWPFRGIEPGSCGMIMADPPWRFATYSENGRGKSAEQHYDTMTLAEIKALPVGELAAPEGAFLWLWATAPMYDMCREVVDAWGFTFTTQGVWVKTAKNGGLAFGTGYILRNCHEPFIIAKKGKPKAQSKSIRSVVMAPRREHSRKPDEAYIAAEALGGDTQRADLFSRQTRPGWRSWGDQTEKFDNDNATLLEGVA